MYIPQQKFMKVLSIAYLPGISLHKSLPPSWRGCVEARDHRYQGTSGLYIVAHSTYRQTLLGKWTTHRGWVKTHPVGGRTFRYSKAKCDVHNFCVRKKSLWSACLRGISSKWVGYWSVWVCVLYAMFLIKNRTTTLTTFEAVSGVFKWVVFCLLVCGHDTAK